VKHTVEIPEEAGERYRQWLGGHGGFIQDALPELTTDQREILMTGTCQKSWDSMFPEEECEDDCDGSIHPDLFCK
jgi:hypothetical protein